MRPFRSGRNCERVRPTGEERFCPLAGRLSYKQKRVYIYVRVYVGSNIVGFSCGMPGRSDDPRMAFAIRDNSLAANAATLRQRVHHTPAMLASF